MSCCRINCRSCLNSFLTEQYLPWYLEKEVWKGWCSSASGYYFLNNLGPWWVATGMVSSDQNALAVASLDTFWGSSLTTRYRPLLGVVPS